MDDRFEEIVGLLLYAAYWLFRRFFKKPTAQPAPEQAPEAATPAPSSPRVAQPLPAPAPVVSAPWRDLDARAADLAALPTPWAIAHAFGQAGRAFFRSTPGLEPELRARMGLPRGASLFESADTLVARDLAVLLGPWLELLFADAWATLALGPAYAVGLRRSIRSDDGEQAVTIHVDEGGRYGAMPPPHLRVLLCCDLLAEIGHRAEASRQLTLWNGRIGAVDGFLLPTRTGWAEIPIDLLRAFGARAQALIADEPLASLGGVHLGALDGLRFSPADQTAAERAASSLASGVQALARARIALAAALLAADDAAGREGAVLVALRRSLAPTAAPEVVAQAARVRRPEAVVAASGSFLEFTPATLREAMVARAILWR